MKVANVEGYYIKNLSKVATGTDYINACASDPFTNPPKTVCVASTGDSHQTNNFYIITGNNPPTAKVKQSAATSVFKFGGGSCMNCGVAVDSIHHKAVLALGLPQDDRAFNSSTCSPI